MKVTKKEVKKLEKKIKREVEKNDKPDDLRGIFKKYLGGEGRLSLILKKIKELSEKERKEVGRIANRAKFFLERELEKEKEEAERVVRENVSFFDTTVPGVRPAKGHLHPLTQVKREVMDIFQRMGFEVVLGPEVETEWYNFDALNVPKDHPARDMWDTFWLEQGEGLLLRTHTSPVQVRYMENNNPPLKIVAPGKVYRHEATNASHEFQLYQLEGLMIDRDVSMANLKGVLLEFFRRFLGEKVEVRLRPSYFPFTEPSCEVDVSCVVCEGEGCSLCSETGWLEMAGAGMVHPKVIDNSGLTPEEWQGFAFGVGLDRLTMIRHKIPEIRWFHSSDLRFLNQF